jgi:peptidyl-prolyl cis-trans isomerase C
MKFTYNRMAVTLIAAFVTGSVWASEPYAVVNDKTIPASHAAVMMAEQQAQGAPDSPQLREAVREELIRREVLAQEAAKSGLDRREDVVAQMDLARQAVLIRAYVQDYVRSNPVSSSDIEREYESIKSRMGGKEYLPRHVLVETENQAKAIIARLRAGEAFEAVASESLDPGSRDRGGELGWSNPGMFVEPFAEAMVGLDSGQFTQTPVQTEFGFHVIQMQDVRDVEAPPLTEVAPQLEQRLQQQKLEQHLAQLRSAATVR